jgi:hypothetical protein
MKVPKLKMGGDEELNVFLTLPISFQNNIKAHGPFFNPKCYWPQKQGDAAMLG